MSNKWQDVKFREFYKPGTLQTYGFLCGAPVEIQQLMPWGCCQDSSILEQMAITWLQLCPKIWFWIVVLFWEGAV